LGSKGKLGGGLKPKQNNNALLKAAITRNMM